MRQIGFKTFSLKFRLVAVLFLLTLTAFAREVRAAACEDFFADTSAEIAIGIHADAYEQWLRWEEMSNHAKLIKTDQPVPFEVARISRSKFSFWKSPEASPAILARFEKFFVGGRNVLWPKHFGNRDANVPFYNEPANEPPKAMRLTASRSATSVDDPALSVKTPTDHPNGTGEAEPNKVATNEDIRDAMLRGEHFRAVDAKFGEDDIVYRFRDVYAVYDKESGVGVLGRDVSIMSDGNYHFPGLSIPYAGRKIAKLNGRSFEDFWGDAYAKALGVAKARLLLRYGLQMETVAQNFLIRLDRQMRPTGHVEVRDLPDSNFVEPVARALGFGRQIEADLGAGIKVETKIHPYWENSRYLFNEAGADSIPMATLDKWAHLHNMAYVAEIERLLQVTIISNKKPRWAVFEFLVPATPLATVQEFLTSPAGQQKLEEFAHQRDRLP